MVVKALTVEDIYYMRGIVSSVLVTNSPALIEQALKSSDYRVKAAGCVLAKWHGKEYFEDLFNGLTDDSDLVRQASRESLIYLNHTMTRQRVDFGPFPGELSNEGPCASQSMWKAQFRVAENKINQKKE